MIGALHDVQTPAGVQAQAIYDLWQILLVVCSTVFVAVMVALVLALRRAPRATERVAPDLSSLSGSEPKLARIVAVAVAVSTILLLGLLGASVATDRALAQLPLAGALHIELTGHQWWWEARYDDAEPARIFSTANELHVPVGRPVIVSLAADDVIHSFWVPSLHGKKDLLPGRPTTVSFRADRPGIYRGQCAEFCGYQHAHMILYVVADPPDDYERWATRQRAPAPSPVTAEQKRGYELFLSLSCALCHAIGGTAAQARHAPDLTHVAGRMTLAAGTIENRPRLRAAWIIDPQRFKPGTQMPPQTIVPADLAALNAYLGMLE